MKKGNGKKYSKEELIWINEFLNGKKKLMVIDPWNNTGFILNNELKDTIKDHISETTNKLKEGPKKVLLLQAKGIMKRADLLEEEMRIKDITGMECCIINGRYEYIGIDVGDNNG